MATFKPQTLNFQFLDYSFDYSTNQAVFNYQINFKNQPALTFAEKINFPASPKGYESDQETLSRLLRDVHLVLGLSYYKLYCPRKFSLPYDLTKNQAAFWTKLYRQGLGEMLYRNNLPLNRVPAFPSRIKTEAVSKRLVLKDQILLGIGGGKDSIVTGELLKETQQPITAFEVATQKPSPLISNAIKVMELPSLTIDRQLDPQIFSTHPHSFNGHIPVSAIIAFLGTTTAILTNHRYVAIGNAASSNFGNLDYDGQVINHQWSKSVEFELLMQTYLTENISPDLLYWSPIRPFFELRVVKLLAKYPLYLKTFSSCNKNFFVTKERPKTLWCGQCSKCAFLFTLLAAHLPKDKVVDIFDRNLFEDQALLPLFADLLGFGTIKPFDCVGPFEETQAALALAAPKFANSLVVKEFLPKIKSPETLIKEMLKTQMAQTIPARFNLVGQEKVLIAGYGLEGKATSQFLSKQYPNIKVGVADQTDGPNYLDIQNEFDLVIKTPGIPKTLITRPHTTATNLFLTRINNFTIGVTGSKGKSTTASLIYHILKTAGKPVCLLGNIGKPMLSELESISPEEILVLELSSYQLDDLTVPVNISVVTNLFPDHLPYHGGLNNYYHAKQNIVANQRPGDTFIYNQKFSLLKQWAKNTKSNPLPFSPLLAFDRNKIPLIGPHNLDNIRAATTVARLLNINDDLITKAVYSFTPLPHRLELVGQFKGISFYDDAISTTPESTIMAIKSLKKVNTIMLGGTDRDYDFTELEKVVKKSGIKNVVLFPDTGQRMFLNDNTLNILRTTSMEKAVAFAYQQTKTGSICLLSTASPSYSLWKNFEDKGNQFNQLVTKLGK